MQERIPYSDNNLTIQTQSKKTTTEEYLQLTTVSKYLFEITILEPYMVHRQNAIKEFLKQDNLQEYLQESHWNEEYGESPLAPKITWTKRYC